MAKFLRKATRRALARRWHREVRQPAALPDLPDFVQENECEIDPTPTPRPVTVDLLGAAPPVRPALGRFAPQGHAPRRRRMVVAFAAMVLFVAGVLGFRGAPAAIAEPPARPAAAARVVEPAPMLVEEPAIAPPAAEPPPAPPPGPRADAHVNHEGYAHVPGGVVFMPATFASADGAYDLYLHFHGNTRVVLESAEVAGLNAVVAVINLGVNSAPYTDAFEVPGSWEHLLDSIDRAVAERGLARPRLRRLAIGSWSGGYGAVSRIFETGRAALAKLDAALVLDGIHCGYLEENPKALNVRIISPFLEAAKRAAEGKILFSITHSEIDPEGYAGSHVTADYLLDAVHAQRGAPHEAPPHLTIRAAEGAVAKKLEKRMEPTSDTTVGTFHVRGYRGNTPEHHMAHLLQMGATVMPELVERWSKKP
jgi:hypothetical protein